MSEALLHELLGRKLEQRGRDTSRGRTDTSLHWRAVSAKSGECLRRIPGSYRLWPWPWPWLWPTPCTGAFEKTVSPNVIQLPNPSSPCHKTSLVLSRKEPVAGPFHWELETRGNLLSSPTSSLAAAQSTLQPDCQGLHSGSFADLAVWSEAT